MIAAIDILLNQSAVTDLVGTRIYPMRRNQKDSLPAITIEIENTEPTNVKSQTSTLDSQFINVKSYGSTYKSALDLSSAVRTALDRIDGTYNLVEVQSIQFLDEFTDVEEINNNLVYWVEQNYKLRIIR